MTCSFENSFSTHGAPYLPWSTFFKKAAGSETIIFLDNVPMPTGRSYLTRCKVVEAARKRFLSVPISRSNLRSQLRKDVRLSSDVLWKRKHRETLRHIYGKSRNWHSFIEPLLDIIDLEWEYLFDMNIALIERVFRLTAIPTQIIRASSLAISESDRNARLIAIGRALGKTRYITGSGALGYLDEHRFQEAGMSCHLIECSAGSEIASGIIWHDRGLSCVDELSTLGANATWRRKA